MQQVLYVQPRKEGKQPELLYIQYGPDGSVLSTSDTAPNDDKCPWINVQARELKRLRHLLGATKSVGRPALSAEERRQRLHESSRRYSESIEKKREELGVPLERVRLGSAAPAEAVERVLELKGAINPETGKVYRNVEIALLIGRSPSFVSRIANGKRRVGRDT